MIKEVDSFQNFIVEIHFVIQINAHTCKLNLFGQLDPDAVLILTALARCLTLLSIEVDHEVAGKLSRNGPGMVSRMHFQKLDEIYHPIRLPSKMNPLPYIASSFLTFWEA